MCVCVVEAQRQERKNEREEREEGGNEDKGDGRHEGMKKKERWETIKKSKKGNSIVKKKGKNRGKNEKLLAKVIPFNDD